MAFRIQKPEREQLLCYSCRSGIEGFTPFSNLVAEQIDEIIAKFNSVIVNLED